VAKSFYDVELSADVCVIGSGAAGLMAVLAARDITADVLVVTKGLMGKGSSTSHSGGGFTAASPRFSPL